MIMASTMVLILHLVFGAWPGALAADDKGTDAMRESCRLFGITTSAPEVPDEYQYYLQKLQYPQSPQGNGWAVGIYSDYRQGGLLGIPGQPMVVRSQIPIMFDHAMFNSVIELSMRLQPQVILAHLRNASSGCNYIADPHPFMRSFNGKWYLFEHNGGLWGQDYQKLVTKLVGDYATPDNCPGSPIDSEYLFLFLLKVMEKTGLDEMSALQMWGGILKRGMGSQWTSFNALLSDGQCIWAVKLTRAPQSYQLHYFNTPNMKTYIVSTESMGPGWVSCNEDSVYFFKAGHEPWSRQIEPPTTEMEVKVLGEKAECVRTDR